MSKKLTRGISVGFCFFCVIILAIALGISIKQSKESLSILEDSVKSQLISISTAAGEIIDPEIFSSYNSIEDIDNETYEQTLKELRNLARNVGAKYIYALKEIDGEYIFVFDTDESLEEPEFDAYELSEVHTKAFAGQAAAGLMNVQDEYGSFNTGAVPIKLNGKVIGVVCSDIEDQYVTESIATTRSNTILLSLSLSAFLLAGVFLIFTLLSKINKMQRKLEHIANYDKLTDLPNRRYLLDQLEEMSKSRKNKPFALYFIDLDNFKMVNDTAGHDAGDELLRHVASYLTSKYACSDVFRPSAGSLNVAARVGGDEFIVIAPGIDNREDADRFGTDLVSGFAAPGLIKYIEKYGLGLSVGCALFPTDSENFHVLIKYADIAMYNAKNMGKNCHRVYTEGMEAKPTK